MDNFRVDRVNTITDTGLFLVIDEVGTAFFIDTSADPLGTVRLQVEYDDCDKISEGETVVWSWCSETQTHHWDEIRKGHVLKWRSADGVVNPSEPVWKIFRIGPWRVRRMDDYIRMHRNRLFDQRLKMRRAQGAA